MSDNFLRPASESTVVGALLWGNFAWHAQRVCVGTLGHRVVHAIITFVEFFPGASQIASLFETFITKYCLSNKTTKVDENKKTDTKPLASHESQQALLKQIEKECLGTTGILMDIPGIGSQKIHLNINNPDLTIEKIKYLTQNYMHLNLDKERIELVHGGKILENEKKLSDYGISSNSTAIHPVERSNKKTKDWTFKVPEKAPPQKPVSEMTPAELKEHFKGNSLLKFKYKNGIFELNLNLNHPDLTFKEIKIILQDTLGISMDKDRLRLIHNGEPFLSDKKLTEVPNLLRRLATHATEKQIYVEDAPDVFIRDW